MWTVSYETKHEDRTPTHGYEATREAAMADSLRAGGEKPGELRGNTDGHRATPCGMVRLRNRVKEVSRCQTA